MKNSVDVFKICSIIYLDIRFVFRFLVDSWEKVIIVTHTPTYLAQIKDNNTKTTPH